MCGRTHIQNYLKVQCDNSTPENIKGSLVRVEQKRRGPGSPSSDHSAAADELCRVVFRVVPVVILICGV